MYLLLVQLASSFRSTNQILFAQNTSHVMQQVLKAVDEQGQQGSKKHLQ